MTESLILKKCLYDKKYFATVFSDIEAKDFESPQNQAIYSAIQELYIQYKKQASIDELELYIDTTSKLKVNLKTIMRESVKEIRNLDTDISDEILIDMTERFIKNKRFKDLLIKGVEVLDGSSKKDSIESLSEGANEIRKLSFKKSAGLDYVRDADKNFLEYAQVEEDGIQAPLEIINTATGGGFKPGTLTIISSVANMGKCLRGNTKINIYVKEDLKNRIQKYLKEKYDKR